MIQCTRVTVRILGCVSLKQPNECTIQGTTPCTYHVFSWGETNPAIITPITKEQNRQQVHLEMSSEAATRLHNHVLATKEMLLASPPIVGRNNTNNRNKLFQRCNIFCLVNFFVCWYFKPTKNTKVMCGEFNGEMAYLKKEDELLGAQHMGRLVLKWRI